MRHFIDPKTDCVFKAILGALGREHLLVHFINAAVKFDLPIVSVKIENLYSESQQISDKVNIVDIKARDESGRVYQIEMQLTSPNHLTSRMTQSLSKLHGQQLKKGDDFTQTKETIAIWLLTNDIGLQYYPKVTNTAHKFHFQMYEKEFEIDLPQSTHLHIIQMNRWQKPKKQTMQPLDYWIYFFMRANQWKQLPKDITIPEIKEAMTVLEEFANDPEKYEYYRARHNIQLAEQSVESEYRQIREDYQQAINKLDETSSKLNQMAELAKSLIATNTMTIEQIATTTGMDVSEINKLIDNQ